MAKNTGFADSRLSPNFNVPVILESSLWNARSFVPLDELV
jgi:hypothetical protein